MILGLPSFRFETLNDFIQVCYKEPFVHKRFEDFNKKKKIMFYDKIPNFGDLRLIDFKNW